jgi:adenosylmethionine-8-amino-7-oxononanoate aminotransferase
MIQFEGPDTVAAIFLEPVQNSGGCFPPPPGYFQRVREICDKYDVLMVSDEVICAFGRIGHMFACDEYGYVPDMITCAKGMTSGYSPIGATIISDRIYEPFKHGNTSFYHGYTFGGHPVSAAVALENLDIFEEEQLNERVRENSPLFRAELEKLLDLPIVGDVRGAGYFFGIELVKDKNTKETFDDDESERLLRGFLSKALFDAGLYCRADDRGDPVVQLAPPLTIGPSEFVEIRQILESVLTEASNHL